MGQLLQLRMARQILLSQTHTFFYFFKIYNLVLKKRKRQDFQQICRCECSGREGGFVELWNEGGGGYVSLYVCLSM